jgi:hypothetical protein
VLHWAVLYFIGSMVVLSCSVLSRSVMYCTALHYFVLYCTVRYSTVSYSITTIPLSSLYFHKITFLLSALYRNSTSAFSSPLICSAEVSTLRELTSSLTTTSPIRCVFFLPSFLSCLILSCLVVYCLFFSLFCPLHRIRFANE